MIKRFLIEWYEMWKYNCFEQDYASRWNPKSIIWAYNEVDEIWCSCRDTGEEYSD